MKYEVYERTGTTSAKRIATYGIRMLAQELVKELELMDVAQDRYEPMRYFVEEVEYE